MEPELTVTPGRAATPSRPATGLLGLLPRPRHDRAARDAERAAVRRATLVVARDLLAGARQRVDAGWLQGGWFVRADPDGALSVPSSRSAHLVRSHDVVAACLVGAIAAAGGDGTVATPGFGWAVDLAWHALARRPGEPVDLGPAPAVRTARVRDLTAWNDARGRTAAEVSTVLGVAHGRAEALLGR